MAIITTTQHLEPLRTAHARVLMLDDVQVIVLPAAGTAATHPVRPPMVVPAAPEDDLQLATWEDAEWR